MDRYFYSQKENGFFTDLNKAPSDAVEITTDEWLSLLDGQDNGMKIVSNQEGYPVLTEQPPLSKENLIALAELKSKRLVRTVLIFTESSDQLSRATDRVPGLPANPGYVQ
ncbi:tail fiber assembly protein [Escherichia coli]|uniref:tail fiber assembly protein n=1 Tax=Escherichia coli TaxID=562 RepID=UPI00202369F2|nr:tail fiber assembly protein [Escherichia coli]